MIREDGPPDAGQDRRYWRRRANRQVRQARRTRTLVRWGGVVLIELGTGAILTFAAFQAVRHFTTTPEFALAEVVVEGTHRTSPESVRGALASFLGRNLLGLDLDAVAARAAADPWIERATVKRILPRTIRVTVEERSPAALAVVRGLVHVVDGSGSVMGPAGPGLTLDQPVLTGLDRLPGSAVGPALARGVRAILRLRQTNPELEREVSEIDLSVPDRIVVVPREPGPRLFLDPERVERNLGDYLALRREIGRRLGLVESVDLRWNSRISVRLPADDSLTESN